MYRSPSVFSAGLAWNISRNDFIRFLPIGQLIPTSSSIYDTTGSRALSVALRVFPEHLPSASTHPKIWFLVGTENRPDSAAHRQNAGSLIENGARFLPSAPG
ncbi:hypothetical protein TWF970_000310 [Orbilia oligospora]|uniref:Uncharacterized protein n=1 Tax=Orbilia oligospora TaxID=2813651 RepID=A0A7C8RHY3_ORBOL|nr:hypothetical protein TWF970_000310 [Orbilia oligospora]